MRVYNLFLKLLKSNIIFLIIYLGIFVLMVTTTFSSNETTEVTFTPNVLVINNDEGKTTESLISYIDLHAVRVEIDDSLEEALYYGDVVAIVTIPDGFSESFTTSNPLEIEVECGTRTDGYQFMNILNGFISTAHYYYEENIVSGSDFMKQALDIYVETEKGISISTNNGSNQLLSATFNMVIYILISSLTTVVALIMVSLRETDLRRRLDISASSTNKRNGILILCNVILGIVVYAICMGLCFYLVRDYDVKYKLLILINLFLTTILSVSFGYLLSVLIKSKLAISALITITSLGLAFITGIFVTQEVLNKTVFYLGRIFPTHWIVRFNEFIVKGTTTKSIIFKECMYSYGIQILFIVLFIGLSLFVADKNKKKEA